MSEAKFRSGHASIQAGDIISRKIGEALTETGHELLFISCGNCRHMTMEGTPVCTKFNSVPPVQVILNGCSNHEDILEIPF